jgi:hypothetical protein
MVRQQPIVFDIEYESAAATTKAVQSDDDE